MYHYLNIIDIPLWYFLEIIVFHLDILIVFLQIKQQHVHAWMSKSQGTLSILSMLKIRHYRRYCFIVSIPELHYSILFKRHCWLKNLDG